MKIPVLTPTDIVVHETINKSFCFFFKKKCFFCSFLKKNQKTFVCWACVLGRGAPTRLSRARELQMRLAIPPGAALAWWWWFLHDGSRRITAVRQQNGNGSGCFPSAADRRKTVAHAAAAEADRGLHFRTVPARTVTHHDRQGGGDRGHVPGDRKLLFETKAALLVAALDQLASEFDERVLAPLAALRDNPVVALERLIELYLDPDIGQPRKVSVWYAFWGEGEQPARILHDLRQARPGFRGFGA
ncbi:MAG: hypothetical protein WDN04_07765 [Rhodospirillales bacterium]